MILAACFTLRGHQFTVVIVSGRQDLYSDASAFSLTSFEAVSYTHLTLPTKRIV